MPWSASASDPIAETRERLISRSVMTATTPINQNTTIRWGDLDEDRALELSECLMAAEKCWASGGRRRGRGEMRVEGCAEAGGVGGTGNFPITLTSTQRAGSLKKGVWRQGFFITRKEIPGDFIFINRAVGIVCCRELYRTSSLFCRL